MLISNLKKISLNNIILILIIVVALFFRFYHLEKYVWMQFESDFSRDMIVAKHIVDNHEFISRGPYAAGGFNFLKNSPIYFYFISIIWFLTRSPVNFMYFYSIFMTLPVLMGYFIGKKAVDNKTGLIFASLLAVNHQMIFSSRELSQPHLLLIFSTGFILSAISFISSKKHKLRNLNFMIFFVMFALHFHYGVLIILPASLLYITYSWFNLNFLSNSRSLKNLYIPILVFLLFFLLWIEMTYTFFPFDQIKFFNLNFQHKINFSFSEQIINTFLTLRQMIWGDYLLSFLTFPLLITFTFTLFFTGIRKLVKLKKNKNIFVFLLASILSVFLLGFYRQQIFASYMLFLFPFFLMLISLVLRLTVWKYKYLGWFLTFVIIFSMGIFSFKSINDSLPEISYPQQQAEIARQIYDSLTALGNNDPRFMSPNLLVTWYTTARNLPFDGWATGGIWFYLETYFDQNLVKNSNYGVNYEPINIYPKIIYVVCEHRIRQELIDQECLNSFVKLHPYLDNEFESILCGESFSVWSLKVNLTENIVIRPAVNPDLLND